MRMFDDKTQTSPLPISAHVPPWGLTLVLCDKCLVYSGGAHKINRYKENYLMKRYKII